MKTVPPSRISMFEWETGELIGEIPTLLGYADDSCWSRGQSWAIAGSLWAYEHTRNTHYLEVSEQSCLTTGGTRSGPTFRPGTSMIRSPDARLDTSASADGLFGIGAPRGAGPGPGGSPRPFVDRLEPMLENLCKHLTPVDGKDERPVGMLLDGCMNGNKKVAHRNELIWGDFHLMETLYCLEKGGLAS